MSEAVHERHPDHLTSLTMINAQPEAIEAIKRYAPDLDVLGVQSYSAGAVGNSIRKVEELWGKPFYFSEFNGRGPWNFNTTGWDEAYEHLGPAKAFEVGKCYDAIHSSPLCLGSTIFTWGHFRVNRPTYFSLLLNEHPDAGENSGDSMLTPQAEVMADVFGGAIPGGNRPPLLTGLETVGGGSEAHVAPGETFEVRLAGEDPDGGSPTLFCWLLDSSRKRSWAVGRRIDADADGIARITAPMKEGPYLVMAYAVDGAGGASASTLPVLVEGAETPE